ncbi:MAG: hypothetical protein R2941_03000 [Desulfobacterales bacterium]
MISTANRYNFSFLLQIGRRCYGNTDLIFGLTDLLLNSGDNRPDVFPDERIPDVLHAVFFSITDSCQWRFRTVRALILRVVSSAA